MHILITGSNGFIGSHITKALMSSVGHYEIQTPSSQSADFTQLHTAQDWEPFVNNVDIVINSVGIITERGNRTFSSIHSHAPKALFQACVNAGVKRIIQISALGANQASTDYQKSKLEADAFLQSLPIEWFILRPSLVYGEGGKSSSLFRKLASLPLFVLPEGGKQRIQPVHISDLVAAVVTALQAPKPNQVLNIVGPASTSLVEWLQLMRSIEGKKPAKVIPIPYLLTLASSYLLHPLMPLLHPDNLRMLHNGNTSNSAPFTEFMNRCPLSLEEGLRL